MKRPSPLLSLPGLSLTFILITWLGLSLWRDGGSAFNPGQLSGKKISGLILGGFASHAEFEEKCELCHQPLVSNQAPLCLECHEDVSSDIQTQSGVHGVLENSSSCADCHQDHRGRSFDPTIAALPKFDHTTTQFSLTWHQLDFDATPMVCTGCHLSGQKGFPFLGTSCQECHANGQVAFTEKHVKDVGPKCVECHDGIDRMSVFDHNQLDFHLDGVHAEISCAKCHLTEENPDGLFAGTPKLCVDCHAAPQVHLGFFGTDCAACHTPTSWSPAVVNNQLFKHAESNFKLVRHVTNFSGNPLTCGDCHVNGVEPGTAPDCVTCHTEQDAVFMADHTQVMGPECTRCHDGVDRMHNFDHAEFFVLDGKHAESQCTACHVDFKFQGTPNLCVGCHAEPDIHKDFFGLTCHYCHSTTAWTPAFLHEHNFPLDHGEQGEITCETCHTTVYYEYTCYGCHDHEPENTRLQHADLNIGTEELLLCAVCHPTGITEE